MRTPLALVVLVAAACGPVAAAETSFLIGLSVNGDAERRVVSYDCDGGPALEVEYINAAPNFLAILPSGEERLVFVAVTAASGVRYVAGNSVWWTKGTEAEFYDVTQGEDAPPVFSCSEHIQTP